MPATLGQQSSASEEPLNIEQLQKEWTALGAEDPLWAVLSLPEKRGGKWDLEEFFQLGRNDIADLMRRMEAVGLRPDRGRALDFGCGVGRLAQALAAEFRKVDGVDVSSTMVEHAQRLNHAGDRVQYHVNARVDLALFPDATFDLVHSILVLQHLPSRIARAYIREFVRVLKPGGVLAIQVPAGFAATPKGIALALIPSPLRPRLHRLVTRNPIQMNCIPRATVERDLARAGTRVVDVHPDRSAGPNYVSWSYLATR